MKVPLLVLQITHLLRLQLTLPISTVSLLKTPVVMELLLPEVSVRQPPHQLLLILPPLDRLVTSLF